MSAFMCVGYSIVLTVAWPGLVRTCVPLGLFIMWLKECGVGFCVLGLWLWSAAAHLGNSLLLCCPTLVRG